MSLLRKATPASVPGERELRAGFLAAVRRTRGGVRIDDLASAIRAGDLTASLDTIDWSQFSAESEAALRASLEQALRHGARIAAEGAPALAVGIAFDLDASGARDWIEQHGAERVVGITDGTRRAIQQRLLRGFTEQRPPAAIARDLREVIGLTPRGELAVERFAAAQAEAELEGAALQRSVARYRETSLRRRASTIARTEVQTALHAGDRAAWDQAIREGRATPDQLERVWRASLGDVGGLDETVCAICRELHGQVVAYDGLFTAILRPLSGQLRSFAPLHPPAHPNCRCRVVTRPRAALVAPPPAAAEPAAGDVVFLDDWRAAVQRAEEVLREDGLDARALAEDLRTTLDPADQRALLDSFHEQLLKSIRTRNAGSLVGRTRGRQMARKLRDARVLRKPSGTRWAEEWDAIRDTLHAALWQPEHERLQVSVPIAAGRQRAFAQEAKNLISLPGRAYSRGTLWHEFGHHLEYRNDRLRARMAAWREQRIALDQAAGRPRVAFSWAPRELMWRDQFFDAYVGRDYNRAPYLYGVVRRSAHDQLRWYQPTETVSMGLEAVGGGDPKRLGPMLLADLEHFFLTAATLLGF